MITSLITLLVAVLVAVVIWYVVSMFIKDQKILTIIGLILGLIVLAYGLNLFGILK